MSPILILVIIINIISTIASLITFIVTEKFFRQTIFVYLYWIRYIYIY